MQGETEEKQGFKSGGLRGGGEWAVGWKRREGAELRRALGGLCGSDCGGDRFPGQAESPSCRVTRS